MKQATSRRRSTRLKGHDYTGAGAYFVTVCTFQREPFLASLVGTEMTLTPEGFCVLQAWERLTSGRGSAEGDAFVVMPNHIHGIVVIHNSGVGAKHSELSNASPLRTLSRSRGTVVGSLSAIIQNLKAVTSRRIRSLWGARTRRVWQRGFYDHVIRNEADLRRIRTYIEENPLRWVSDEYYASGRE
ncbi:MAG TPA: transposase [Anaerolineales bacterium]|nr:transposase [Anaerolineales bacterium]